MAKEFTNKELMMLGKELKEAKAKVMGKWGFTADEIAVATGMPRDEVIKFLPSGRFHWGDESESDKTE